MLLQNFISLFLESAPWLLLGLFLAGMLKMFVPMEWMHKQLGGHGLKTTIKAALFGAPLPLCSCGVIPAAVGLRRSGASKAATTSFMVSTPETGVDSVSVSYVLLGPFMAIVRPIAAVISAVVAGLLVGRDEDDEKIVANKPNTLQPASSCCSSNESLPKDDKTSSCCASKKDTIEQAKSTCCSSKATVQTEPSCCSSQSTKMEQEKSSCCSSKQAPEVKQNVTVLAKVINGLKYASTDLVRDTALWLLIGLFFAALVQTYVPSDFLAKWGDGILAMLVMVLISVPMYICATASTPIAAGLLLAGVSPGAVLVFMMAGPATNIATLGVVSKELGKRALYGYLGGVLGVALVAGVLVNYLVENFGFQVMPQVGEHHELLPHWLVMTSGILLAVLMTRVLLAKLPKSWWRRDCCS